MSDEDDKSGGARERTLDRMKRLIFASTLVAAACSKKDPFSCRGYAVVDPMPPPAGCAGIASQSKATAQWKDVGPGADGGGAWIIELTVSVPAFAGASFETATAYAGKLTVRARDATSATIEIAIDPQRGGSYTEVTIPVHCDPASSPRSGNGDLGVQLQLGKPGEPITASIYDR